MLAESIILSIFSRFEDISSYDIFHLPFLELVRMSLGSVYYRPLPFSNVLRTLRREELRASWALL